jgi:hypothetical protein
MGEGLEQLAHDADQQLGSCRTTAKEYEQGLAATVTPLLSVSMEPVKAT